MKSKILNALPRNKEYSNYIHENDVENALDQYASQVGVGFAEWLERER